MTLLIRSTGKYLPGLLRLVCQLLPGAQSSGSLDSRLDQLFWRWHIGQLGKPVELEMSPQAVDTAAAYFRRQRAQARLCESPQADDSSQHSTRRGRKCCAHEQHQPARCDIYVNAHSHDLDNLPTYVQLIRACCSTAAVQLLSQRVPTEPATACCALLRACPDARAAVAI